MTAWYNEIDPIAAETLRELIKAGVIAPGVVDERSIEDVTPAELAGFTQCHFFAGGGIWSYALRRAGWPDDRPVWTGSCPCQPFSSAGKGEGFADERHLWPAWFHLISQFRPAAIYGEQVASSNADPWIDLVHADLEALGYAFGSVPFPAAGIGAPHIRDRNYWFAGVAQGDTFRAGLERHGRHGGLSSKPGRLGEDEARPVAEAGAVGFMGNAESRGCGELGDAPLARSGGHADGTGGASSWLGNANSKSAGRNAGNAHAAQTEHGPISGDDHRSWNADIGMALGLANMPSEGRRPERTDCDAPHGSQALRAGEEESGRCSAISGPGPVNGFWRIADWLYCRDGKWRPVESGTFPLAPGTPSRVGQLRIYGNGLCAEAAVAFIKATEDLIA